MSTFTPTGTIAFLQNYNAWRRGDETLEMPHPAEIGANIQDAIVLLRKYDSLLTEGDQLRAEVERLRAGIAECLSKNGHLADGEDCTLIGLKRCLRDSRVERSDAEQVDAWASWANTCMHHNDAERGRCGRVCPVCITSERDQLRDQLAAARQRETVAIASWDEERGRALREGARVVELKARAERAEDKLAALSTSSRKECRT